MALTEEQQEQIRKNRERALALLKKRKDEQEEKVAKKRRLEETTRDDEGLELEDFEINAPPLVTKKEAMSVYCLPEGTLEVCEYVEKENPHKKGWTPMKLYSRSEIRRRARKRFGGLEGLLQERKQREMKKFQRDLEQTKDMFKGSKK
jgi:DNA-repair protein complementing XP-A cells